MSLVGCDRFPSIGFYKCFDLVFRRSAILELFGAITSPSHLGDGLGLLEVDLNPTSIGLVGYPAMGISGFPIVDVFELMDWETR